MQGRKALHCCPVKKLEGKKILAGEFELIEFASLLIFATTQGIASLQKRADRLPNVGGYGISHSIAKNELQANSAKTTMQYGRNLVFLCLEM